MRRTITALAFGLALGLAAWTSVSAQSAMDYHRVMQRVLRGETSDADRAAIVSWLPNQGTDIAGPGGAKETRCPKQLLIILYANKVRGSASADPAIDVWVDEGYQFAEDTKSDQICNQFNPQLLASQRDYLTTAHRELEARRSAGRLHEARQRCSSLAEDRDYRDWLDRSLCEAAEAKQVDDGLLGAAQARARQLQKEWSAYDAGIAGKYDAYLKQEFDNPQLAFSALQEIVGKDDKRAREQLWTLKIAAYNKAQSDVESSQRQVGGPPSLPNPITSDSFWSKMKELDHSTESVQATLKQHKERREALINRYRGSAKTPECARLLVICGGGEGRVSCGNETVAALVQACDSGWSVSRPESASVPELEAALEQRSITADAARWERARQLLKGAIATRAEAVRSSCSHDSDLQHALRTSVQNFQNSDGLDETSLRAAETAANRCEGGVTYAYTALANALERVLQGGSECASKRPQLSQHRRTMSEIGQDRTRAQRTESQQQKSAAHAALKDAMQCQTEIWRQQRDQAQARIAALEELAQAASEWMAVGTLSENYPELRGRLNDNKRPVGSQCEFDQSALDQANADLNGLVEAWLDCNPGAGQVDWEVGVCELSAVAAVASVGEDLVSSNWSAAERKLETVSRACVEPLGGGRAGQLLDYFVAFIAYKQNKSGPSLASVTPLGYDPVFDAQIRSKDGGS